MIPAAEKLLEQAKNGEKLGAPQRRHVLAYLMATRPEGVDFTNDALGELFQVTSRTIRVDKNKIRGERAKMVREEDVGLVVADILIDYDRTIRDLEASKNKCKLGTRERRAHNESIMKMRLETVQALQNLGFLPKNLGQMAVQRFEYKANVSLDGSVDVSPVPELPAPARRALSSPPVIEGELVETHAYQETKPPISDSTNVSPECGDESACEAGNVAVTECSLEGTVHPN